MRPTPGSRWVRRHWSTMDESSSDAMWKMSHTDWACAPNADWSVTCISGGGRLVAFSCTRQPRARYSCRAGAAGSCCSSTAAGDCWSTPPVARRRSEQLLPEASVRTTWRPDAACRRESAMADAFDAVSVIRTKRDGGELRDAQIDWVIDAFTRGRGRRRADGGAGHGDRASAG